MTSATERRLGDAVALDYDMHPRATARDGVTLYIRHGRIMAMVEHVDGSNSNVSFNQRHDSARPEWRTDWRQGTTRQCEALDRISWALHGVSVEIGATAHHILLHGAAELAPATRRMLVRRLGLAAPRIGGDVKFVQGINVSRTYLDTVTDLGASIRYVFDGGERRL